MAWVSRGAGTCSQCGRCRGDFDGVAERDRRDGRGGGFVDARLGRPMSFSTSALAWGFEEFWLVDPRHIECAVKGLEFFREQNI